MKQRLALPFKKPDVLGLGCVAIDDICHVSGFPAPDTKTPILHSHRQFGGLVGTALVAAARLGAKCAYGGVIGDNDLSIFAVDKMQAEGIDTSHVERNPKASPVHSFIVVDKKSGGRNIFFDESGLIPRRRFGTLEEAVKAARVLLIDHLDTKTNIRAARIARNAGIPVVADFEDDRGDHFPELLELVDHLVLSLDFSRRLCRIKSPAAIARKLWNRGRKAVVITCGADGCWYLTQNNPDHPVQLPAFPVRAVDTTGCGDVFHGAYAAALARGMSIKESLRFSSAVAACRASGTSEDGFPTQKEIEAFLKRN